MESASTGALIRTLRRKQGLTPRELANQLCVTDKAVSKWERDAGCPDVDSLHALAQLFHVDMENLLSGSLSSRPTEGGNMKRIRFYICPRCGNVLTAAAPAEISCCGYRLEAQRPTPADESHLPHLEKMDGELCLTFSHEMTKAHYLRFAALITFDRMTFVRLYPEQDALVRLPDVRMGTLVFACAQHGLMSADVRTLIK